MSGHMGITYRYRRFTLAAVYCFFRGHRWLAYDLNLEKCLRCCKERGVQ